MMVEVIGMTVTDIFPLVFPPAHSVFHGVSWEEYSRTLQELEAAGSRAHVTFDNGEMEIVTNADLHERAKTALGRLLETYALEADIPITGLGQITCRREDLLKGLDPDECYYVMTPVPPRPQGSAPLDLHAYPPPDLAIEIEVSQSSVPKQPIYAGLGIAEVWRYDGQHLVPLHLTAEGKYAAADRSIPFPALPIDRLRQFLDLALSGTQHAAAKAIRDWVRSGKA
jgi:Uma2 family endonuclease